jgi:hypothetical protein
VDRLGKNEESFHAGLALNAQQEPKIKNTLKEGEKD